MPTQPQKDRLTDEEKKKNHLASEQRRREAIRREFDMLSDIVPGMQGMGRSENTVLGATVTFLREQILENQRLIKASEAAGHDVSHLKLEQETYEEAERQMAKAAEKEARRERGEEVLSSDEEEPPSPRGRKRTEGP